MRISPPIRASRTYVQRLIAEPARAFPLLCPVREADWIEGWHPLAVFSHSGVAEPDCVFLTAASPQAAVWYITRHEPDNGFLEMLKVAPEVTACRLTIQLRRAVGGSEAEIWGRKVMFSSLRLPRSTTPSSCVTGKRVSITFSSTEKG